MSSENAKHAALQKIQNKELLAPVIVLYPIALGLFLLAIRWYFLQLLKATCDQLKEFRRLVNDKRKKYHSLSLFWNSYTLLNVFLTTVFFVSGIY